MHFGDNNQRNPCIKASTSSWIHTKSAIALYNTKHWTAFLLDLHSVLQLMPIKSCFISVKHSLRQTFQPELASCYRSIREPLMASKNKTAHVRE